MRNLKKLFAVVLVIAVMLTAMVPAFAAGTATDISADAKACATLGMLKGPDANGVTAAYTQTQPSRIQAAIMLLRLKGLEADALKATGDNFSDVKAAWMKPFTAYLKANPSVGFSGIGDNKFDPDSKITAQQYYKVLLTALGYTVKTDANATGDFTWDDTIKFAESKGLTKATKVASFKVEDIAVSTVEALKAKLKDGSKTLTEDLIAKKVFTKDQAISAGIVAAVPTSLTATLTPLNLAELQVSFSDAVDKDSIDVTKVKVGGIALIKDKDKAILGDDGKTVTVYAKDGFTDKQSKDIKISISDVKTKVGGVKMTEIKDQTVRFVDTAIPTIKSVKAIGNKKIEVVFSEAMDPTVSASKVYTQYKIDGKALSGNSKKSPKIDYKTLTIDLASKLDAGTHKFNFLGDTLLDYAQIAVVPGDIEFTVDNDTSKPTVTVDKVADQSTLYLRFNKEVDTDKGSIYWYNGSSKKNKDSIEQDSTDKTLYKVTFTGSNVLPLVATTVYVDGFYDYFGNQMDKANFTVTATPDTLRPEVKSIEPDPDNEESVLIATFNKDVDIKSANVYGAIVVKDKDGKVVKQNGDAAYVKDSGDKDIKSKIKIFGTFTSGTYTVTTKGIQDMSAQSAYNKSIEQTFTVSTADKTGPRWESATNIGDKKLVLVFNKEMDAGTVSDTDNYQIETVIFGNGTQYEDTYMSLPSGVDISVSTNGKVVTLDFPEKKLSYAGKDKSFEEVFASTAHTHIGLKNVKDSSGNELAYQQKLVTAKNDNMVPVVKNITVKDKNTVVLAFENDTIGTFPVAVDTDDFIIEAADNTDLGVEGYSIDNTKREITLTTSKDFNSDLTYGTGTDKSIVKVTRVANDDISSTKDAFDNPIKLFTYYTKTPANENDDTIKKLADGFAPSVVLDEDDSTFKAFTDTSTTSDIVIQFSEKLQKIDSSSTDSKLSNPALGFAVLDEDDGKLDLGEDYTIKTLDSDPSKVILTICKPEGYRGFIQVALENSMFVLDLANNKAEEFDFHTSRGDVDYK